MSVASAEPEHADNSALRLARICKSFDGQAVLIDAQLDVQWGELHAVLGENGAGKSTLMNTLCGLYTPDSGETWINAQPVTISKPADATRFRIGMVHQHYKLVDRFTVAENVLLACAAQLKIRSVAQLIPRITAAAQTLGFSIDPSAITRELSIAEQQRLEIIKLVLLGVDILILDEPTAVLTDEEAQKVLSLLRRMADQGKAVIFITHRLKEVAQFADRVTVMRAGKTVVASAAVNRLSESAMAEAMVGQSIKTDNHTYQNTSMPPNAAKTPCLSVRQLKVYRPNKRLAVDNVSLDVHAGEILGLAGVGGNGQTQLAEALFGIQTASSGEIELNGERIDNLPIAERRQRGLRLVPADRFAHALIADLRAYENLAMTEVPTGRFGKTLWLRRARMKADAASQFNHRDILGGNPNTRTRLFSGGNAQKLLLARELRDGASLLIAHSPTRGLDVRARQSVHDTLMSNAQEGGACLLISEDLDEVLALATRIGVLSRGRLHGPWPAQGADAIDRTRIGELMAGHA